MTANHEISGVAMTPPVPLIPGGLLEKSPSEGQPRVKNSYIWLMVLAQFGVFMAFITPLAISLSIKISQLAPGREEYLGFVIGAGAFAVMLTSPLFGVLSDRTKTRIGRRRPFMIMGMVVGVIALFVMASAPSVLVLGIGWVLAQMGWGQVLQNLQTSMADKLPESQRGKVAGLTGFATQIAPVFGVVIAGLVGQDNLLLFLIPGVIGVLFVSGFVIFIKESDSRGNTFSERFSGGMLAKKYFFNPRHFPDFSWNWAGRFMFYFGLTLNSTYTAFFFASRLDMSLQEVAGVMASLGIFGILCTTFGAIGGGFLSDKVKRRKIFVLLSGVLYAIGALTMAFAPDMPILIAGSLLTSVGLGAFSAVDQALLLDVLPERETDAGRYMGIVGFATSIPQALAPLVAPLFLAIGIVAGGEKNYSLLYIVSAVCTLLGGMLVLRIKSVR